MSFNYHVRGIVPAISQPSSLSCWETVGTMMLSWKEQMSMTIGAAMDRVGQPYTNYFTNNRVLPWAERDDFGRALGLKIDGPQCYTVDGLLTLLSTTASPLFTGIAPGGGNGTTHIVAITGLSGDGSLDGTTVHFNDPAGGRRRQSTFRAFTHEYESGANRPGLTAYVMHY
ncbi:MAG: papain-like cysteine protease family protein [Pseudomonadota bacterium]